MHKGERPPGDPAPARFLARVRWIDEQHVGAASCEKRRSPLSTRPRTDDRKFVMHEQFLPGSGPLDSGSGTSVAFARKMSFDSRVPSPESRVPSSEPQVPNAVLNYVPYG